MNAPSSTLLKASKKEQTPALTAKTLKTICLEEGAGDAGVIPIERPALDSERKDILNLYPRTRSLIAIVQAMNRENIQSPARYAANDEFHRTIEDLTHVARRILKRLNGLGVRGVVPTVGFPMDMDRWGSLKIWDVSHKHIAEQAGMGKMGKNRNVIHPRFGNFVLLETILIDTVLDQYDEPLTANPCVTCNLCVAACPVGAIHSSGEFDFSACYNHNYREFMGGFQDWVEGMVSADNVQQYRSRFKDSETVSFWQSLSFGANYKSAYCMAVCPAGEDVFAPFAEDKKQYVQSIVKPLTEKKEPVYARPGTTAEKAVRKNPRKTLRPIRTQFRPASIDGFLHGIQIAFNREKADDVNLTLQFIFTGKETRTAWVRIVDRKITVKPDHQDTADLTVTADTATWLRIVNRETHPVWALLIRRLKVRGRPWLLTRFQNCIDV